MLLGIIGKPNAGKSTFFKSITKKEVGIAPYPFTTINPNFGVAYITAECPCKEMNLKCNPKNSLCINGIRKIPVNVLDVPGLIPEAHKGKGLGNKFLDELRNADVLIQVVDVSGKTDQKGEITENFDPSEEILIVEREINLWFLEILKRNFEQVIKKYRSRKETPVIALAEKLSGLGIKKEDIEFAAKKIGKEIENLDKEELEKFASALREKAKPMLYACNKIDLKNAYENFLNMKKKFPDKVLIPTSAESELALKNAAEKNLIIYHGFNSFEIVSKLEEKQEKALEFMKYKVIGKIGSTGVQEIMNKAIFDILNYIVVYPVENENTLSDSHGNVLPDAILIKKGSKAIDLAFKIHSEIGENFIRAIDARTKKAVGRDYVLKDKDILKIVFKG